MTSFIPKISVIMPVYNAEKSLNRSIESILNQSFQDFELIIVNDGSTDSSASICQEYANKDSRIRFISQSNAGASAARNAALNLVTAPWITFCDADDFVYPHWLQNFVGLISEQYDLLIQGFEANQSLNGLPAGGHYGIDFNCGNTDAIIKLHQLRIFGYLWVKAFRLDIINSNHLRFDTALKYLEDEIFILDYMRYARRVKSIADVGYSYSVPDFDNKYSMSVDNSIYLWSALHNRYVFFEGIEKFNFYKAILGSLSDAYIAKIIEDKRKNWHFHLACLKELLRNNKQHPMNLRLQNLILHNPYELFTCAILISYYYTRKMFR